MQSITRVYIDMDGVTAAFYESVCRLYGVTPWPYPFPLQRWDFFQYPPIGAEASEVKTKADLNFYVEMDKTPYADEILSWADQLVGRRNVFFLSAPWHNHGCCDGKRLWIAKHYPDYLNRTVLVKDKTAAAYPGALLIDDSFNNVQAFRMGGGPAILFPRPWNYRFREVSSDGMVDLESVLCLD